jgi:hypothetical protein
MAIEFYFECVTCQEKLHPITPGEPTEEESAWVRKHSEPGHNMEVVIPMAVAEA